MSGHPFHNFTKRALCLAGFETRPQSPSVGAKSARLALKALLGGAACSVFESKFKAPKTPPSHGLTGLSAIESGAKPMQACGVQAAAESCCAARLGAGFQRLRRAHKLMPSSANTPGKMIKAQMILLKCSCTHSRLPNQ